MKMRFTGWRGLPSIPLALVFTLAVAGASPANAEIAFVGMTYELWYCLDWPEYCSGGACETGCYYYQIPYIATVGADGSSVTAVPGAEGGSGPAWSPDGAQIAFERDGEIFVIGAAGGTPVNLTNHPALDTSPAWSPDGSRIAFASDRAGQAELYLMNSDGSDPVRVTQGVGFVGNPAWSPGGQIVFDCEVESGNRDVCAVKADGTGFARLTNDLALDAGPAWSPAGSKLAFSSTRTRQQFELYVMNPDGSGVTPVGGGMAGVEPAWSPDGQWIAFASQWDSQCGGICVYVVKADGTNLSLLAFDGYSPVWNPAATDSPTPNNVPPIASFTSALNGLTCSFDGSSSSDPDGTIASHAWNFGDGTIGSGATVSHTYAAGGTYVVTLTVTDNGGSTATQSHDVKVNTPPIASFTTSCGGVTCTFDGSASSDSDGAITSYAWNLGDGTTVSGPTVRHTYATGGTYPITLTVTDDTGATGVQSRSLTVIAALMHVGDLDRATTNQGSTWTAAATITMHDGNHSPVASATVSGSWSNGGTGSCTTNTSGQCAVPRSAIPKNMGSVVFTVVNVTHATLTYRSPDNHDPDGDSNGTTITVSRP